MDIVLITCLVIATTRLPLSCDGIALSYDEDTHSSIVYGCPARLFFMAVPAGLFETGISKHSLPLTHVHANSIDPTPTELPWPIYGRPRPNGNPFALIALLPSVWPCENISATEPCGNISATEPCGNISAIEPCGNIPATGPCGNIPATGPCGNIVLQSRRGPSPLGRI